MRQLLALFLLVASIQPVLGLGYYSSGNSLSTPVSPANGGTGSASTPSSGQLPVGNAGGTAYAPQTLTGDVTVNSSGVTNVEDNVNLGGNPTATTQAATNNSTRIATTAYVYDNLALPDPWNVKKYVSSLSSSGGIYYPAPAEWSIFFSGGLGTTANLFPFVYQPITGDFTFSARLDGIGHNTVPATSFPFAGLFCAEGLAAGGKGFFGAFDLQSTYPGVTGYFTQRTTTDGAFSTVASVSSLTLPYWIRLVRSGTTIQVFRSADGSSWTQIGTDQTLTLSDPVNVGFIACFDNLTAITGGPTPGVANFSNVSLTQP